MSAQTCFVLGRREPSDLGNAWNLRSRVGGDFIMIGHRLVRGDIVGTTHNAIKKHIWPSGLPHLCWQILATHTSVVYIEQMGVRLVFFFKLQ